VTFRPRRSWIGPLLLIAVAAILVAACVPGSGGVDASGNPISPSPHPPLEPAEPGADPVPDDGAAEAAIRRETETRRP